MIFTRIIYSAVLIGMVTGLLLSLMQILTLDPIIFQAESYEISEPDSAVIQGHESHDHDHSHAEQASHSHEGACCSAPAFGPSVTLAASTSTRLVVHIADMDCPAEENMIRSGLKKLDQVQNLGFDLMQRVLTVDHVDGARDKVLGALRGLGFEPRMADEEPVKQVSPKQGLIRIAGAVVLADGIGDHLTQFIFSGDFNPIFNVGNQDQTRHGRRKFVMPISAFSLVFNEIQGFLYFTDIMIIPANF